jgi:dihydroorotate dehydrogenase (fumarate)
MTVVKHMAKPVDTSLSLCGITLSNPLILAAGPYSRDTETLTRAVKAGFGAVTTKTIRLTAAKNPFPNMAQIGRENLINAEKWSDLPLKTWLEHEIPEAKRLGVPVIASVGLTEKEVRKIAPLVEEAGADFVETVSYDAAKAERSGADAISALDSIGPVLAIDVESGKPYLGSVNGEGWLSGAAIHPIAVKNVADIARTVKIPVIGIGGVTRGRDVVEMIMAGAHCVELCTAPLVYGLKVVNRIKQELAEFMQQKKYMSLQEFRGAALKKIQSQTKESKEKLHPNVDTQECTHCGLCVKLCPYQALIIEKDQVTLDKNKCLSCGLCHSVCPHHAITLRRC